MIETKYTGNPEFEKDCGYKTVWSAGCDLVAQHSGIIPPHTTKAFSTGLFIEKHWDCPLILTRLGKKPLDVIPELQIRARSSMALKGIVVAQGVATIDVDYAHELKVILLNTTEDEFTVRAGERIAQLIGGFVFRVDRPISPVVRTGGFGSTGR